jgi:hypothetical protein
MKFISKNSNLHIILRPGQQAQPITGTPAIPALSVRFQQGQADIQDESLIEMMMRHPGFNQDFVAVDETGTDPFAHMRADAEPQHVTTEMKFGHPVARNVAPSSTPLPPAVKKLITDQATEIANKMVAEQLPGLVAEALKSIVASQASATPATVETASTPGNTDAPAAVTEPKPKNKNK